MTCKTFWSVSFFKVGLHMYTVPQNRDKFTINNLFYCCKSLIFTHSLIYEFLCGPKHMATPVYDSKCKFYFLEKNEINRSLVFFWDIDIKGIEPWRACYWKTKSCHQHLKNSGLGNKVFQFVKYSLFHFSFRYVLKSWSKNIHIQFQC